MYQFNKIVREDKLWCFELGGINLLLDGFFIKDEQHWIKNPQRAIAFFNVDGNIYGVSNLANTHRTAEAFFDVMREQYSYFCQEDFSPNFCITYGFEPSGTGWLRRLPDDTHEARLEYIPGKGWCYNGQRWQQQPQHVADLLVQYQQQTGQCLHRIS